MTTHLEPWTLDPDDPRAPSQDVWERLSDPERARVVATLPSEFPVSQASPPEGDKHSNNKTSARDTLRRWFDSRGRDVYLGSELPIYYPGEPMFAPDIMAVLDVSKHEREHWHVSSEGKGLDVAIEIFVHGRRSKDFRRNVDWFARLGISEYFVYEVLPRRIHGWRLSAPGARVYDRIVPQGGRFASVQLGLDLAVRGERLRFFVGNAVLRDSHEVIEELTEMVDSATARAEEEARRAEEEARRADEATQRADGLQRQLDALRAQLGQSAPD